MMRMYVHPGRVGETDTVATEVTQLINQYLQRDHCAQGTGYVKPLKNRGE